MIFFFLLCFGDLPGHIKLLDAVNFHTKFTGDFVFNHSGGIDKGYTYMGMEDFSVCLNTDAAGLWNGGQFFFHALNTHGKCISQNYTGDLQILSNIEAGDYTGLYEYYYMHEAGKFSFLLGQHDLNSEFVGTKYGGTFVNSSFGIAPGISLNMPVSIYPVAAPCMFVKYSADKGLFYKIAVYDGDPGNFESNRFNLDWNINSEQGFFTIGELEFNQLKDDRVKTTYKLGAFHHSGRFLNYTDTISFHKGNYGIYAIIDKPLFSNSLSAWKGLCFFVQVCITPDGFNMVTDYVGGGFRYHGILPNRYYDELGIAFARIGAGNDYKNIYPHSSNYETALEATYNFSFGRRYFIQPSLQYIFNPGMNSGNCFVSLLRFSLEY
jgi:porin